MATNWSARRPHIQRTPGEEYAAWCEYKRLHGTGYANAVHGLYKRGVLLVATDFSDEARTGQDACLFELFSFCGNLCTNAEQRMRIVGFVQQYLFGDKIDVFRMRQNEHMVFVRYVSLMPDAQRRQAEPLKFMARQLEMFE